MVIQAILPLTFYNDLLIHQIAIFIRTCAMAPGLVLDPSKCSKLSMDEKRELVYALSEWSHGAPEMLQSWSRQEILEILCAEMGKERKYTGLTKLKIIEQLLKIVSEKKSQEHSAATAIKPKASTEVAQRTPKRQRKTDNPNHLPFESNMVPTNNVVGDAENTICCKNSACRAKLCRDDAFCKRCSCCICHQYDENKDPSLWLICSSEPPFQGESCGMSCHLECALRHERSGIAKDKQDKKLDGSFYCVSCGKVNDTLRSWRKQLLIARDTRRVDILCYRVSLSQKILGGTKRYQNLKDIVDEAVKNLEADVGPLTGLPVKMARGIVNRLSSGPEVQRLCALAIDTLDSTFSATASDLTSVHNLMAVKPIMVEDVCDSSVTVTLGFEGLSLGNVVGYTLWHRKADDLDYPAEPTCTLFAPSTKFLLPGLTPDTDYLLKVVSLDGNRELGASEINFRTANAGIQELNPNSKSMEIERSESPATNCSSLSNPSSVEDETNNVVPCSNDEETRGNNYLGHCNIPEKISSANLFDGYTDKIERGITGETISLSDEEHSMGKISPVPDTDAANLESKHATDAQRTEDTCTENESSRPLPTGKECVPYLGSSEAVLPSTPCKVDNMKDGIQRSSRPKLISRDLDNGSGKEEDPQAGSSSKKRSGERRDEESTVVDKDFEYYVKVIRWLECDGHIETGFRQKFLTWYSLRATPQEVRIVKVFVDTFIEDPASLAGQLIDTFSDVISNKRSTSIPAGFCLKLWH